MASADVSTNPKSRSDTNRELMDSHADMLFGQDWVKKTIEQEKRFLRAQAGVLGLKPVGEIGRREVRLLDYACGNGAASWALAPYVTQIRGIDVSPTVVTLFNRAAGAMGFDESKARAVVGDFSPGPSGDSAHAHGHGHDHDHGQDRGSSSPSPSSAEQAPFEPDPALSTPEFTGFDVAIACLALHHLSDPQAALSAMASRLRPGGVLVVMQGTQYVDGNSLKTKGNYKEPQGGGDGQENEHGRGRDAGVSHATPHEMLRREDFIEENLRKWFAEAGCDDAKYVTVVNDEVSSVPEEICKIPGGLRRYLFFAASVKA